MGHQCPRRKTSNGRSWRARRRSWGVVVEAGPGFRCHPLPALHGRPLDWRPSTFPFRSSHKDIESPPAWRDGYSAPRRETGLFGSAISADAQVSQGSAAKIRPAEREGGRLRQQADERRGGKPVAVGLADRFGASSGAGYIRLTVRRRASGVLCTWPTEHNWTNAH